MAYSDVKIVVSGKEFLAHKIILSGKKNNVFILIQEFNNFSQNLARSVVFEKMFQHDMKENLKNKVDLNDIVPEVFEELLKYIYTGKVSNLQQMAPYLLDAAFKVC